MKKIILVTLVLFSINTFAYQNCYTNCHEDINGDQKCYTSCSELGI